MPTLLVIDDDPAWRALYRLEFEKRWEVLEAPDGIEGLALLESLDPDLVIVDLQMPRMDGFAFVQELKRRGWYMPVIISSSAVPRGGAPPSPWVRIVEKSPDLRELRSAVLGVLGFGGPDRTP